MEICPEQRHEVDRRKSRLPLTALVTPFRFVIHTIEPFQPLILSMKIRFLPRYLS